MKNRDVRFDLIRTLAIFLVIICHANEVIYDFFNLYVFDLYSSSSKIMMFIFHTLGRMSVPFFLYLSGALLLRKQIESDEDILSFYQKKLVPLLIVNTVWVILYNIYFYMTGSVNDVTIGNIIQEIFLLKQVPVDNMWYMPMILGMYIAIPFIAKLVKSFTMKSIFIGSIVVFSCSFLLPAISILLSIFQIDLSLESLLDLNFLGGKYGLYILLGYYGAYIPKHELKKITLFSCWILIFFMLVSFQIFCYYLGKKYHLWYDSPLLLISSFLLYILLLQAKNIKGIFKKFIRFFSSISFSLFFIHIIIQKLFKNYILSLELFLPFKVLLLFLLVLVISSVITYLFSKIKGIKKYILFIR